MEFLLYGAYGYTGQLITEMAKDYGLKPVLSGRNAEKLQALASEHNLDYLAIDLHDQEKLRSTLERFPLVLHAAGPFKYTARPMMEACLATGTHYLDITGEIEVFELGSSYDAQASAKNIMIMPGVGFDVVPTDCLGAYLKQQLPDATHLRLAFATLGGGVSKGTASTMLETLGEGSARRINGKITKVPIGENSMTVDFGTKKLLVMSIPWGDVSTAYYTTGIPNIETFTKVHPKTYKKVKWQNIFRWVFRVPLIKNFMKKQLDKRPAGPSAAKRATAKSVVWGEVKNAKGEIKTANLETVEGYTLTAMTSLMISKRVLTGDFKPGFQTPAGCYGADLVREVKGTKIW